MVEHFRYFNNKVSNLILCFFFLCSCTPETAPPPTTQDNSVNISLNLENPAKLPVEIYETTSETTKGFKDKYINVIEYTKNVSNKLSTGKPYFVKDSLSKIIESDEQRNRNPENKLKIILTDFANDSGKPEQLNNFANYLSEKYLKKGLSIGLLKLNSQFDGKVINQGSQFNYQGDRNFYLMSLGKYENIFNFYKSLKKTSQELSNENIVLQNQDFAIFSNNIIFRTIHFEDITVSNESKTQDDKYKKIFQLDVKDEKGNQIEENPLFVEEQDNRIKQFSIPTSTTNLNIDNTFNFHKFYFTPDFKLLKPGVKVESFDSQKREFEIDDNLSKTLKVEGYEIDTNKSSQEEIKGNKKITKTLYTYQYSNKTTPNEVGIIREGSLCKYHINIDTTKLTEGLIYRIQVTLYPSQSSNISNMNNLSDSTYILSNPYGNWNMELSDLNNCSEEGKKRGIVTSNNCGKTLNIKTFVEKLLESINLNENNKQIKVAEFFYYLKKQ